LGAIFLCGFVVCSIWSYATISSIIAISKAPFSLATTYSTFSLEMYWVDSIGMSSSRVISSI
jgi:hypothetical protein